METAAWWTGLRVWLGDAELYLPRNWLAREQAESQLLKFYQFPNKHWKPMQTTNIIE